MVVNKAELTYWKEGLERVKLKVLNIDKIIVELVYDLFLYHQQTFCVRIPFTVQIL